MKAIKLNFGDKVTVNKKYVKQMHKYVIEEIKPKECIYLGKRVIREGFNDEGYFCTTKMITCYLFAYNLKQLIFVPIELLK